MIQPSLGRIKEFLDLLIIVGSKGDVHTDRLRVRMPFVYSKDLSVCCADETRFL
jgi:hypothetical protein